MCDSANIPRQTYYSMKSTGFKTLRASDLIALADLFGVSTDYLLGRKDAEAIRYLENNKVWKRDDMEKYALLRGLYDDLNNYRLSNLKGTWKTKLEKSSQFQKLTGFIENGAKKEKAKKNIASGPFSNDGSITVYRWACMVDP